MFEFLRGTPLGGKREVKHVSIHLGARTDGMSASTLRVAAKSRTARRFDAVSARQTAGRGVMITVFVVFLGVAAGGRRALERLVADPPSSGVGLWLYDMARNPVTRPLLNPNGWELALLFVALPILWRSLPPNGRIFLVPVMAQTAYVSISKIALAPSVYAMNAIISRTINALSNLTGY